jgi:hypothetical protein
MEESLPPLYIRAARRTVSGTRQYREWNWTVRFKSFFSLR